MSFPLTTAEELTASLDAMIKEVCPTAGRRAMYGGLLFEKEAGNAKTAVCGHFVYKQHVGLEFSQGYLLDDPAGVLEGNGKFRRHIKLKEIEDIDRKGVRDMLERAFA